MSVKLTLQNLAEWIGDAAKAAKGSVTVTLESGLLKDSLDELCEIGGVAGALFKLGARAIPDPTPEQRIAARLHGTFLTALDSELKERPDLISEKIWKDYVKTRLPEVATAKLAGNFTWLSIFGSRGKKPGRSWPIVGDLADLGRAWIAEMAALDGKPEAEVQRTADDVRGRLHEALSSQVDKLLTDPAIVLAINEAQPRAAREALDLLAEELTTLRRYRLFGEIPQEAVYIPPRIKKIDLKEVEEKVDWKKVEAIGGGDEVLYSAVNSGHPRLLVIEGDMGVGKSCLMRLLAARLGEQFRRDRRRAPVYVRWRDIYLQPDLSRAIADEMTSEYGLPLSDLPDQADIIYLVDGFDEMSSHQEGYVIQCFERLAKLVFRSCSVIVAMRSTVITPGLRLAWKNRDALVAEVQPFDDADVEAWAEKWSLETGAMGATGERLRFLSDESVSNNPLLLYMLAKYVEPMTRGGSRILTRAEVFRTFVDETIRGKLRTSREEFPFAFPERDYRLFLQEIAFIASWPRHAPKCPARVVRERVSETFLKNLNFQDVRTAFVLHFFEPTDAAANEFEFQPEGFRQYLLAEWCVRAQLEALRDEDRPVHPLSHTRADAMNLLAQFPLGNEERRLLNEIYEDLGHLAVSKDDSALSSRLNACLPDISDGTALDLVRRLYERVRGHAEIPPEHSWKDEKTGVPAGQEIPPGLDRTRLLCNYWDQCMLAVFGLYRGLDKHLLEEAIFYLDNKGLERFILTWRVVRGYPEPTWNLARLNLVGISLSDLGWIVADLHGANLRGAECFKTVFSRWVYYRAARRGDYRERGVDLRLANLTEARMTGAELAGAALIGAKLVGAELGRAYLFAADLSKADLSRGNFEEADLRCSDLSDADLTSAEFVGADLREADLTRANLTGTDLSKANLDGADLRQALVSRGQIASTKGTPKYLPEQFLPDPIDDRKGEAELGE